MTRITNFLFVIWMKKDTQCFHLHYPKLEFPLEEHSPFFLCAERATHLSGTTQNMRKIPNPYPTSWTFLFLRFSFELWLTGRKGDRGITGPAALSVYVWAAVPVLSQPSSHCTGNSLHCPSQEPQHCSRETAVPGLRGVLCLGRAQGRGEV